MARRLAILDDNQRLLEERLGLLRAALPGLVRDRVSAAMVIGSVAEGRPTEPGADHLGSADESEGALMKALLAEKVAELRRKAS